MRSSGPVAVVDDATRSRSKVSTVDDRCSTLEATVNKLLKRGEEGLFLTLPGVSLDVVGPVEKSTEPLRLRMLAHGFRIRADINVFLYERIDLGDNFFVEETIVVRSCGLDGTTSPPAAT